MKIALIGYGKMGKAIEELALKNGHEITDRFTELNKEELTKENLLKAEVAIEFTEPHQAANNIRKCFAAGIPVVSGTTGWLDELEKIKSECAESGNAFFYASNYSIGVNIFFEINKRLAELMNEQPAYDEVLIHETHHIEKLDSPSGTAITLATQAIDKIDRLKNWVNYKTDENVSMNKDNDGELPVFSSREKDVPGTHIVKYFSDTDEIEITHKALSREGFATGALAAAEWIRGKKGVFGIKDLLNL